MLRFASDLSKASFQALAAANHANATLSARVPMFFNAFFSPTPEAALEWSRAWMEKAAAMVDGAVAAQATINKRMMRPGLATPLDAAETWLAISSAALRPAHRRVRANARRLGVKG